MIERSSVNDMRGNSWNSWPRRTAQSSPFWDAQLQIKSRLLGLKFLRLPSLEMKGKKNSHSLTKPAYNHGTLNLRFRGWFIRYGICMDLYLGLPIFELHPQNLRWKQHKLSKTFKDHQKASKMMILYTSFDQSCYMFCCVSPAATGSSPLLPFRMPRLGTSKACVVGSRMVRRRWSVNAWWTCRAKSTTTLGFCLGKTRR